MNPITVPWRNPSIRSDLRRVKNALELIRHKWVPGGSFRIIVPDAGKYFRAYSSNEEDFFKKLENLGGSMEPLRTPCEVVNRMFRMWEGHRFAWDYETLRLYMADMGFVDIALSSLNDVSKEYNIDGDEWWREVESLYVNAMKAESATKHSFA